MKPEKRSFLLGTLTGLVFCLVLFFGFRAFSESGERYRVKDEFFEELEFSELLRSEILNYNQRLDITDSDYIFEKGQQGNIYLIWIKYVDALDRLDYNYARLGQ